MAEIPPIPGERFDGRINFVERPVLNRAGVTGERADPEPNDGDLRHPRKMRKRVERLSEGPRTVIVGQRLMWGEAVRPLEAVERGSMIERVVHVRRLPGHPIHTEERPSNEKDLPIGGTVWHQRR